MIVLAHDFETTGIDPRTCGVCQSAIAIVEFDIYGNWNIIAEEVALHHPGEPIPDGAARVHGIHDKDVAGLPSFEESIPLTYEQAMAEFGPTAVLGYNSNSFDNLIAKRLGLDVDSMTLVDLMIGARRMMNRGHIERARLSDAYEGLVGKPAVGAHDAMADVKMTLELIKPIMKLMGFEDFPSFIGWLNARETNVNVKMPFGKHKGKLLKELPKSYLNWLIKESNIEGDFRASVEEAYKCVD